MLFYKISIQSVNYFRLIYIQHNIFLKLKNDYGQIIMPIIPDQYAQKILVLTHKHLQFYFSHLNILLMRLAFSNILEKKLIEKIFYFVILIKSSILS